jgi:hypothetical protein
VIGITSNSTAAIAINIEPARSDRGGDEGPDQSQQE